MKILFLSNVPSPYRVDFFNELGKYCELTVVFEKKTSDERDKSWKKYQFNTFKGIFLKGKTISADTAFCPEVIKYIKCFNGDKIICTNISSPTVMLAIQYMKWRHIEYYLEADGGTAKSGKGIKESIKAHFISGAKSYLSTSESCDNYFIKYGASEDKIFRYPFTSLFEKDILNRPLKEMEKVKLRNKLNLKEDNIIISVGRFSYLNGYGKGYDTLLNIAERIPESIGIYIIGDEPTNEFIKWKKEKYLSNVHFVPFKLKEQLFEYYKAADLSILLSRGEAWGLVVNESMANGTPVLTTDACVAGKEIIKDGRNGFLVSVNDVDDSVKKIKSFLFDKEMQENMMNNSLKTIKKYTIENMAKVHLELLK